MSQPDLPVKSAEQPVFMAGGQGIAVLAGIITQAADGVGKQLNLAGRFDRRHSAQLAKLAGPARGVFQNPLPEGNLIFPEKLTHDLKTPDLLLAPAESKLRERDFHFGCPALGFGGDLNFPDRIPREVNRIFIETVVKKKLISFNSGSIDRKTIACPLVVKAVEKNQKIIARKTVPAAEASLDGSGL